MDLVCQIGRVCLVSVDPSDAPTSQSALVRIEREGEPGTDARGAHGRGRCIVGECGRPVVPETLTHGPALGRCTETRHLIVLDRVTDLVVDDVGVLRGMRWPGAELEPLQAWYVLRVRPEERTRRIDIDGEVHHVREPELVEVLLG